ncbi:hypothetical protein AZE42_12319, partial [Rhizopogon vesiculosus]
MAKQTEMIMQKERQTGKSNDTRANGYGDGEDKDVHTAILHDLKELLS